MPIRFRCPACRQILSVTSRKAGQRVDCPACQATMMVPVPAETPVAELLPDEEPAPAVSQDDPPVPGPEASMVPPPAEPAVSEGKPPARELELEVPAPVAAASEDHPEAAPELDEPLPEADVAEVAAVAPEFGVDAEVEAGSPVVAGPADEPFGPRGEENAEDDGFSLRRAETEFDEMDLTPMVDVTFLLLIFFMITASFSLEKAIAFPPPNPDEQGAAAEPKQVEDFQDKSIIVEIQEDNSIWIDGESTPPGAEITELLKRKMISEGKTELLIDAHDNALHETVVRVVDAGNDVEMQRIRLGARTGG